MTAEEIFKTMQDLIAEQFAIDAEEITMDSSFVDDLGAEAVSDVVRHENQILSKYGHDEMMQGWHPEDASPAL